jgi:hypothetical protein
MSAPRSRLVVVVAAVACAAATAGVASAQAAAPAGMYGGGAIEVPVTSSAAQDIALSIRAQPNGTIGVGGEMPSRCGRAAIRGRTRLTGDGSFTLRGTTTRKPSIGVRERSTFVVKGRLTADGGTGTVLGTLRVRRPGRAARTCKTRTVKWTVRPAARASGAPAAAPAEALLYGLTSQDGPEAKHAIVLHVTDGGRSIDRMLVRFRGRCAKRVIVVADEINYSPEFDVAADGSFREVERFKVSFSDVVLRTTVVVRGQFDAAGGAAGKLAVTQRFTNRRNGKRVDVCTTGTLTWSARQ